MLIAVATKEGKDIDQHFGHAERFLIYDVEGDTVKLVDEKKIERYCSFDEGHPLRGHILRSIAEALDGCRAVVTARIGPAPQDELERLGFNVYTATGEIRTTVVELAKLL